MDPAGATIDPQLRRGVLEHCVLSLVSQQPMYGLDLARALHEAGVLDSEGTLYPLLARLRARHMVETTWEESPSGPPRRYYRITSAGETDLTGFRAEWRRFSAAVDSLIGVAR